jgi:ribose transport system substrate-binding protein
MRLLGALLPALLFCAACRTQPTPVIGVIPKDSSQLFWQAVHAGAVKAGRESNVTIDWQAPAGQFDATRQSAIVETMIEHRVAGIVIVPVDPRALAPAIARAAAASIPVVLFAPAGPAAPGITEAIVDGRAAGLEAASRLGEFMRGEGKAAMLSGERSDPPNADLEAGFVEGMKANYPKIKLVRAAEANGGETQTIAAANDLLDAHPDLDGLFTGTLTCTEGAVYALRARATTRVRIVAFQASPDLVNELHNRFIDTLLVPDSVRFGYDAVSAVVTKLRGGAAPARIACRVQVIDRTNAESPESVNLLFPDLKSYLGTEGN